MATKNLTARIRLSRGMFTTVDARDYARLSAWTWCAARAHPTGDRWYAVRNRRADDPPGPGTILMHREIARPKARQHIDHVDGNGLNNTRKNLRIATHAQNMHAARHKTAKTTSRFRGVSWSRQTKKWVAQICINYHRTHLGLFATEKDAAKAYDDFARERLGEFFVPNLAAR